MSEWWEPQPAGRETRAGVGTGTTARSQGQMFHMPCASKNEHAAVGFSMECLKVITDRSMEEAQRGRDRRGSPGERVVTAQGSPGGQSRGLEEQGVGHVRDDARHERPKTQ